MGLSPSSSSPAPRHSTSRGSFQWPFGQSPPSNHSRSSSSSSNNNNRQLHPSSSVQQSHQRNNNSSSSSGSNNQGISALRRLSVKAEKTEKKKPIVIEDKIHSSWSLPPSININANVSTSDNASHSSATSHSSMSASSISPPVLLNVIDTCPICTSHLATHGALPCHHTACIDCWKRWLDDPANRNCMLCAMPIEMVVKSPYAEHLHDKKGISLSSSAVTAIGTTATAASSGDEAEVNGNQEIAPLVKFCDDVDALTEKILHEMLRLKDEVMEISSKLTQSKEHLVRLIDSGAAASSSSSLAIFTNAAMREGAVAVIAVEQLSILEQYERVATLDFNSVQRVLKEMLTLTSKADELFGSDDEKSTTRPEGVESLKLSLQELADSGNIKKQWKILNGIIVSECLTPLPDLLRICDEQEHRVNFLTINGPDVTMSCQSVSEDVAKIAETGELLLGKIKS